MMGDFLGALGAELGCSGERFDVVSLEAGSVRVTVSVPPELIERLEEALRSGALQRRLRTMLSRKKFSRGGKPSHSLRSARPGVGRRRSRRRRRRRRRWRGAGGGGGGAFSSGQVQGAMSAINAAQLDARDQGALRAALEANGGRISADELARLLSDPSQRGALEALALHLSRGGALGEGGSGEGRGISVEQYNQALQSAYQQGAMVARRRVQIYYTGLQYGAAAAMQQQSAAAAAAAAEGAPGKASPSGARPARTARPAATTTRTARGTSGGGATTQGDVRAGARRGRPAHARRGALGRAVAALPRQAARGRALPGARRAGGAADGGGARRQAEEARRREEEPAAATGRGGCGERGGDGREGDRRGGGARPQPATPKGRTTKFHWDAVQDTRHDLGRRGDDADGAAGDDARRALPRLHRAFVQKEAAKKAPKEGEERPPSRRRCRSSSRRRTRT